MQIGAAMKRIAVITSGGDSAGMNPALKSIVEEAERNNISVTGLLRGFRGIADNNAIEMYFKTISGIARRGGTILKTSRYPEFKELSIQKKAVENLHNEHIDGLIILGGDGSMCGALALSKLGVPVVGIPASIDNDLYGSDISLGVDTSLNMITHCIDIIKDTASSHNRAFVIETMGRESGYLALVGAMATGSEALLIPEIEYDIESVAKRLKSEHANGRAYSIIIVSEGTGATSDMSNALKTIAKLDTRITVLGHLQRGGSPSVFDRILGFRLGSNAVQTLMDGVSGVMMGLMNKKIVITPFIDVLSHKKELGERYVEFATRLSH